MTEEQVRGIALFFFFTLMDEKVALQASRRTSSILKGLRARGAHDADTRVTLIKTLRKVYDQHRKLLPRSRATTVPEGAWGLPEGLDISIWLRFQKDASDLEVAAVVLSQILGYGDQEIAEGLGISVGTARYRVGKGVRQLGQIVKARA